MGMRERRKAERARTIAAFEHLLTFVEAAAKTSNVLLPPGTNVDERIMEFVMPMTRVHDKVWNKITQVYQEWDQDRSDLMEIDALPGKLPDVERELIGETLAEALLDGRLDACEETGLFRPIPNH